MSSSRSSSRRSSRSSRSISSSSSSIIRCDAMTTMMMDDLFFPFYADVLLRGVAKGCAES